MDTNWKGWTARRSVKITCFILAIIAALGVATGAFLVFRTYDDSQLSPEIVLADMNGHIYFYDNHVRRVLADARTLLYYDSEEKIKDSKYLEWQLDDNGYYLIAERCGNWWLGSDSTPEDREELEQEAIQQQLYDFKRAKDYLDNYEGLHYYISGVDGVFSNTAYDTGYFTSLPVHHIATEDGLFSDSHRDSTYYMYYDMGSYSSDGDYVICVGFDDATVGAQSSVYSAARTMYTRMIIVLALAGIVFLFCLTVLILGAGRRFGDEEREVRLLAIDRPYTDLSLIVIATAIVLIFAGAFAMAEQMYYHNRIRDIYAVVVAAVAVSIPLFLYWVLAAAKHVKNKTLLRNTFVAWILRLTKRIIVWAFSLVVRFFRSLWAGVALTGKVFLILTTAAVGMVIVAALAASYYGAGPALVFCILFLAAAAVLLLRYAQRIQTLAEGAKAASAGKYDQPISVGGGELGSIAESINNISAGINLAVDERMKSERLKTELITNVSHDIRTPLTSIITYTDLLKNEGLDCDRADEYLDVLVSKSQRLKVLTDELFEAAKAASGSIDVKLEPINVSDLMRQVFGELDERVQSSGLDFRLDVPESAWAHGDGKLLWRVMENLLSNVFKYSLPGSRVYIDVVSEEESIRFDMKNISRDPLNVDPSELTERFKRGDEARTGEGNGLGLSIVQSFVDAMGGRFALSIDGDLFKASVSLKRVPESKE